MTKTNQYLSLTAILAITIALYLWPDFHPERVVTDTSYWWMDLVKHGGYFLVATFLLLVLRLPVRPVLIAVAFFAFSVGLEFMQQFSYNRSVDMVDVACNLAGVVGAIFLYKLIINN